MPRYNQYNRHRMSLNTVDFQPTVFTPIEFKPVEQDYSILDRAMAKQEERKEKAITQQSLVKQALGKAREQLHQDDDTLRWFDAKARDIENNIQLSADLGDYSSALETGITAAGDIANDKELAARIRTNAQYNEEFETQRKRIGQGISQATFDWWVENNPYSYENIYDDNNNVIGGKDWKSNFTPVDDLDTNQLALTAFKLLSPEKGSSSSSSNAKPGSKTEYGGIGRSSQSSYEKITVDRIYDNINEIIGSNPNNWRAVRQGFQVALNELDKLKKERDMYPIDSPEYALKNKQYEDQLAYFKGENNQELSNTEESWKLYTARVITDNAVAKGLAYSWRTSGSAIDIDKPTSTESPTYSGGSYFGGDTDKTQSSSANMVIINQNTGNYQREADNAGQSASNRFIQGTRIPTVF